MMTNMSFCPSTSLASPSLRRDLRPPLWFSSVATLLFALSTASSIFADSATWKMSPATGNWNHAANWTPPTIPNGPSDRATFAASNTTSISVSGDPTEVNGIVFNAGASAFTITPSPNVRLTISGVGIINNSGVTESFVCVNATIFFNSAATAGNQINFTTRGNRDGSGFVVFRETASAGNATFTNEGGTINGGGAGQIEFENSSTASNGTFINNGSTISTALGGTVTFLEESTAGNGTFINNGSAAPGGFSGETYFFSNGSSTATAGNATIINNGGTFSGAGGGSTSFSNGSISAGNATLIANSGSDGGAGGAIRFSGRANGGTARVEVFGNGSLDVSVAFPRGGLKIGSIEGDGDVFLGGRPLIVGTNNLSTTFSGKIQDDGNGGSLTKVGRGKLVLRHANSYAGGTTVERGTLAINNTQGSGTGSGPVQVNSGTLGGKGIIAGVVTVGTGIGSGAVLAPGYEHGANKLGALTMESQLTFNADATYNVEVNSSSATADGVIANGVTINNGAQFLFGDVGFTVLPAGTIFTLIDNTATTLIAGTFSNLPDGSVFTANGNTYQVNYDGGDGNDLTLTVVP